MTVENMTERNSEKAGLLFAEGEVIDVEGELARVTTLRETGCSGCQSQKSCGTATLAQLFSPRSGQPLEVENVLNAKAGDTVLLSMEESHLIKHSLMAYGVPLLGLFIGALVLQGIFSVEVVTILGGVLGLFFGWGVTRYAYKPKRPLMYRLLNDL